MKNKQNELLYKRRYRKENHEYILKYAKEYSKRPDVAMRKKAYMKDYRLKNKDKLIEYNKRHGSIYYKKNKKEVLEKQKNYYQKNKTKKIKYQVEYNRNYRKNKYKTDPEYNIRCRLRSLFHKALDKYSSGKEMSSNKYGIDYDKIIEKLKPFPEKISLYHIDHIIPLCSFDLTKLKEIKKAFAPENHQWLLAENNLKKGGRYDKT